MVQQKKAEPQRKTLPLPSPAVYKVARPNICTLHLSLPTLFPVLHLRCFHWQMELARMVILLVFISSSFYSTPVHARSHHHYHKKHPKHGGSEPPEPPPSPSISLPPVPAPSPEPTTAVLNVLSFGAVGDGVSDDTEAFKSAWDSACEEGPGVVLVPQGYAFKIRSTIFAGPCHGELTLQAVDSSMGKEPNGGISPANPTRFFMSSNLAVHGIRIRNSPQFHFRFDNCRNVTVDTISINSPALSPNTDGIHVENSVDVGIYNSVISSGDDCVSIGAGSTNIHIRNLTCGPGHGISIGSLGKQNTRACVTNVTVKDSVIKHSDNGVRIKTWQGGSGSVSWVSFENIRMDTVRNPIIINQYYCLTKVCKNQTSAVYVSDVSYAGIKGSYDTRSPPIHFGCSDAVPCTNITLTDVELLPAQGDAIADPFCWNVYGESQTLTIPPVSCLLQGLPRSIMDINSDRCY
ncbi:hypothetical protein GW17_00037374 [Ensete ventricosum]|nr:hypothetical protein GW17_00037374 [Ensete ventricosum]